MIKVLAVDLDGTLTNSKKEIPEKNRTKIMQAQKKGVKVVLASGRPLVGISASAQLLNLSQFGGYIIGYNGGQVIECSTGRVLMEYTIPQEFKHDICSIYGKFDVTPLTYDKFGVVCERKSDKYVKQEAYNNNIKIKQVDSLEEYVDYPVIKYMVVGEHNKLEKAREYLINKFGETLNIFYSEPYFLEIMPSRIEKGYILEKLCYQLDVTREELMVCGDGLNDIFMFEKAGVSIAMGNACKEVKGCASYVSGTNDECGVAEAIDKYILN